MTSPGAVSPPSSRAHGQKGHRAGRELGLLLRTLHQCDTLSIPNFRRATLRLLNDNERTHILQRRGRKVGPVADAVRKSWPSNPVRVLAAGVRRRRFFRFLAIGAVLSLQIADPRGQRNIYRECLLLQNRLGIVRRGQSKEALVIADICAYYFAQMSMHKW
jgi:hypothetical protein